METSRLEITATEIKAIKVNVNWEASNYSYGWAFPGFGAIVGTARTLAKVKDQFEADLLWQIDAMKKDGDDIPAWLAEGRYVLDYELSAAAMLRHAEKFTTMAAISRATGINQKLLSHYANALKIPRPRQRQRIIEGLHIIGNSFLAIK